MAAAEEQADRRQQILEAAMRVFSSKGFQKATNKDVAEEAGGISPGLIYWYFKDKEDLLFSLIRERVPILQLADHPERLMELPPREALTLIGRAYLGALNVPANVALIRIILGELTRYPELADMFYRNAVARIFGAIDQYLQRQIELGHLRPHDTSIATRSFVGNFIVHVLARELFHQPSALATSEEDVVAFAVEVFLRGLEPDGRAEQ